VNRPLIVGIAGAAVIVAAIVLTLFIDREPDRPIAPGPSSSSNTPNSPTASGQQARKAKPPASRFGRTTKSSTKKPSSVAARPSSKAQLVAKPNPPAFDIVRVNPQGDTVIAGRAPPDSEITVRHGDKIFDVVKADKRGEWVLVPQQPLPAGTYELTVTAKLLDGTQMSSGQNVVVIVPEKGKDLAGDEAEKPEGAIAVAIPKKEGEPPVVLQTPTDVGGKDLAVDAIDYGRKGDDLTLSGRAEPGTEVRVYLNNKFIGRARVDEKGIWRLKPDTDIPTGMYRLRVDRVDGGGQTLARIELPFLRATPIGDLAPGTVAFVQPGNSLWRLARQTYGSGLRYTEIFEANKDQIRDPDLIYPGQVFVLPKNN
jgi:nucleoid-associated protein YgaU